MGFRKLLILAALVPALLAAGPGGSALKLGAKGYLTKPGLDVFVFTDGGTDKIVGYEKGEKFDLSDLDVTWSDVTITATSITVDLDGTDDLVILLSTTGITASDFIFG